MTEYRIVELHRRFHIEERINGKEWHDVRFENVPRYFDTLADARWWVATIKRGVVYHGAEDVGLQWFLDRVGKMIRHRGHTFKITDNSHANRLYDASVWFGHEYTDPLKDAPNLAQDERKAESGVKVSDEWEEHITRHIASLIKQRGLVNGISVYNVTVDDEHIRIYT